MQMVLEKKKRRKEEKRTIGQSRCGNATKIHRLVDGNGRPIDFEITGGEVHDSKMAYSLMLKIKEAGSFIADKGYHSEFIRE
ncbi:MAG: transposase [Endozoicomonadaceae bacterium]|nr:transposase [Endozoicomonadaceae bacterium]